MFEIGEMIIHRDHGLCKIAGIEHVAYVDKDYFVLYPNANESTKIMIPCEMANSICRRVVSKEECLKVIEEYNLIADEIIKDNKKRKEEYTKLLHSDNLKDLVYLIKMLDLLFEEKSSLNKVIGTIDSSLYNEARKKLFSEITYVLEFETEKEAEIFLNNKWKKELS